MTFRRSSSNMSIASSNSGKRQHSATFQIFMAYLYIFLIFIAPLSGSAQSGPAQPGGSTTYDSLNNAMSQLKEDFSKADGEEKLSMSLEIAASSLAATPAFLHADDIICASWYANINMIIAKYAPRTAYDSNAVTIVKKAQELRDKLGVVCDPHTAPREPANVTTPQPEKPTEPPATNSPTPEDKKKAEADHICALQCRDKYQTWRDAAEESNKMLRQLLSMAQANQAISAAQKSDYQQAAARTDAAKAAYDECMRKCYQQAVGAGLIPAVPSEFAQVSSGSTSTAAPSSTSGSGMQTPAATQTSPSSPTPKTDAPPPSPQMPPSSSGALKSAQSSVGGASATSQVAYSNPNGTLTSTTVGLATMPNATGQSSMTEKQTMPATAVSSPVQTSATNSTAPAQRTQAATPITTQPNMSYRPVAPGVSGRLVTPSYQPSTTVRVNNVVAVGQNVRPGDYVTMDAIVHEALGAQWRAVQRTQAGAVLYQSPTGQQHTASFANGQIVIQ
jgi:hypothetical protein